jgi:hypothetical protein
VLAAGDCERNSGLLEKGIAAWFGLRAMSW